ncbi:MAG: hypothetical protein V3T83_21505, partial [Acidobacteriota bacterium]
MGNFHLARICSLACMLALIIPGRVEARQEMTLEELVRAYLWPRHETDLRQAQERLRSDASLNQLSRDQFVRVEAALRLGRPVPAENPTASGQTPPLQHWSVETAQGPTDVLVQLPPGYHPNRQWPLLLAMHGGPPRTAAQALGGARRMIQVWRDAAGNAGWIVAAPVMASVASVDRYTAERLPYEVFHPRQARAVIEEVSRRYAVQPDRIVSTGISLGSNFSIALAAAHPDWFSAIVPVSTEGESRQELLRNLQEV